MSTLTNMLSWLVCLMHEVVEGMLLMICCLFSRARKFSMLAFCMSLGMDFVPYGFSTGLSVLEIEFYDFKLGGS